MNESQEAHLDQEEFRQNLEAQFGPKLLMFLEDYFENMIIDGQYMCNPQN